MPATDADIFRHYAMLDAELFSPRCYAAKDFSIAADCRLRRCHDAMPKKSATRAVVAIIAGRQKKLPLFVTLPRFMMLR